MLASKFFFMFCPEGQLISKANCHALNSSKKRTNEFIFTTMQPVFIHFLEEIEDTKKPSKLRDLWQACFTDVV